MVRGLTTLRWAVVSQAWGRPRTVAASPPSSFGVHDEGATTPYRPRAGDDALETALGAERPLVVVTGPRLAGTSRAVHRAVRRMLGDHRLLELPQPHTVDLADALGLARGIAAAGRPVVVLADDAPPALLDQVAAVTDRLDAEVRLVLTTRRAFLDAHPDGATHRALAGALVVLDAGADGPVGERVRPVEAARAVLAPDGTTPRLTLALLRAAVDWERLGVETALTPETLVALAPPYLEALGAEVPDEPERRAALTEMTREPVGGLVLLRAVRRRDATHLVADRVLSHLADRDRAPAGWPVPEALGRELWARLEPAERARVARVALARGDEEVALWLAAGLPPDDFAPSASHALGGALAERPASDDAERARCDEAAAGWLAAALEDAAAVEDAGLVRRVHRSLGELELRRQHWAAARTHLLAAVEERVPSSEVADVVSA